MFVLPKTLLVIIILFLFANSIVAFQTSSLHIVVTNTNNEVIENFTARLKNNEKLFKEITNSGSNSLTFLNLEEKNFTLEIEATGFKAFSKNIKVAPGRSNVTVILDIQEIIEKVEIKKDIQQERVDNAFGGFFTRDQIEALPDSGEEIERELKRRYGPDTIIRVDGYGGRVPPKSKIASIKVSQSTYDAENHELGFTYVDITTKVAEEAWTGSVGFNFNNQYLNARNPFALSRLPESNRPVDILISAPLKQNKSSFDLWFIQNKQTIGQNIIAVLPEGRVSDRVTAETQTTTLNFSLKHNLTKTQYARLSYNFSDGRFDNQGVGNFDLPERAFSSLSRENSLRFSVSGYIGKNYLNEFRSEFRSSSAKTLPLSENPAILVLDAFNSGGAGNPSRNQNKSFSVADNFLFGYKKHALKIGGLFLFENKYRFSKLNENGAFTFSSLADFLANRPSLYTQSPGTRESKVNQVQIGVFIQDDYRLRKDLNLSLGLRYERQNNLSDANNYSPQLGITWSPFKSGKATFRGGAGIFYNWLETNVSAFIANQSIDQPGRTVILNPGFPEPTSGGTSQILMPSYWFKAENLKNPYIIHSSFGVESQLNRKLSLRVNYIFQKGVHQFRSRNINAPLFGARPNKNFGNITQVESSAFFVRNSLDVGLSGVVRKGISFGINYTLQKRISDNDGIYELPSNNYNLALDRSAATNDQRHRIYSSVNWKIRRGLLITAIYNINSPLPYTITTGIDNNNDTSFNDRPLGVLRNSERGTWRNQLDLGGSWTFSFFNFKGRKKGNSRLIYTNAEVSMDNETTELNKRFSTKLFFSVRNTLNQTNLSRFVGVQTSPYFNQPIFAENPRRIDLGLRFNF